MAMLALVLLLVPLACCQPVLAHAKAEAVQSLETVAISPRKCVKNTGFPVRKHC